MHRKFATLIGLMALGAGAQAHHSNAMFDQETTKSLTGTVRQFQWTNPHCYIQLVVRNDKGVDEEWSVEMGAPMYLYGRGWRPSTLKPGDRISVKLNPLRSGSKGGLMIEATAADGKPIGTKA